VHRNKAEFIFFFGSLDTFGPRNKRATRFSSLEPFVQRTKASKDQKGAAFLFFEQKVFLLRLVFLGKPALLASPLVL
jgi:hypothetical protein